MTHGLGTEIRLSPSASFPDLPVIRGRRGQSAAGQMQPDQFIAVAVGSHLPGKLPAEANAMIPFPGFEHLFQRRFEEALNQFLAVQQTAQGTMIYLVSDDNYNPFQQTLLLQYLLSDSYH